MTRTDFVALLPMIVIGLASLVVLVQTAVRRNHKAAFALTAAGEVLALASIPSAASVSPRHVTALLVTDTYSLFFSGLLLAGSFAVTVLAYGYLEKRTEEKEEFYVLLLIATLGSLVLVSSGHFVSFFLGLEILSVSLYIMIAYMGTEREPLEAGLKYLVLASASSAFLVFGMALVYAEAGTMDFSRIAFSVGVDSAVFITGFALIIGALGFKLALVPFHMWTPDVYQGAPAPVAAFVATVSKGAVFALLMRYFTLTGALAGTSMLLLITILSIASMIAGNILALLQNNLKRLLAYSSIAHLGYLLVAFVAGRDLGVPASTFYLLAYFISILAAFGVISVLSTKERDADAIDEYHGLFWRRPWLALVLSASLFSLAGIPLTAGFMGKFYLLAAGIGSARWLLVIVLVVTSAIGLYYYLRVIVALYGTPPLGERSETASDIIPWTGGIILGGLMIALIWFGIYPTSVMHIIQAAGF